MWGRSWAKEFFTSQNCTQTPPAAHTERFKPEKRVCSQLSLPGTARELLLGPALSYSLLQADKHQPRLAIAFKRQPAAMGKRLEDHKYWLTKHWNRSKLPRKGICWVRVPVAWF